MLEACGGSPIHKEARAIEPAHHAFDFAHLATPSGGEPLALGLGKSCKARATRRRSSVTRGVCPNTRSEYSAKLAIPSSRFTCVRYATISQCARSEEHTSELQSRENIVCRLLLEKKKTTAPPPPASTP